MRIKLTWAGEAQKLPFQGIFRMIGVADAGVLFTGHEVDNTYVSIAILTPEEVIPLAHGQEMYTPEGEFISAWEALPEWAVPLAEMPGIENPEKYVLLIGADTRYHSVEGLAPTPQ